MQNLGSKKKKEYLEDKEFYLRCALFWAKASESTFPELRQSAKELSEAFMVDLQSRTESLDKDIVNMLK